MTLRHNHIRTTTANLLNEVCKDVRVEPQLQPLSGETISEKTANKSDQDRVDISARGFCLPCQVVFLTHFSTQPQNDMLTKNFANNTK